MTVVMPIGPKCEATFINDTLASIDFYAQEGWRLVIVDDSGHSGFCQALSFPADTVIVQSRTKGTHGGLYLNLSCGFSAALDQPFDILLRMDTDALVIGSGFEQAAAELFRVRPDVGLLGPYRRNYDGTKDDHRWAQGQIVSYLTRGWFQTPAISAALFRLVARASLHGYLLGESVDGGICIYSRSSLERLRRESLLGDARLGRSLLEEDHLFSLALRSCGIKLADFGSSADTLPIGSRWHGLAASPAELIRANKALIHSTKSWGKMDEAGVRAEFASRRS